MYSKKTQLANRTETKSQHTLNLQLLAPSQLNKYSSKKKQLRTWLLVDTHTANRFRGFGYPRYQHCRLKQLKLQAYNNYDYMPMTKTFISALFELGHKYMNSRILLSPKVLYMERVLQSDPGRMDKRSPKLDPNGCR